MTKTLPDAPDARDIAALVDRALTEDIGDGDLTSKATVPETMKLQAAITARQDMVVAGIPVVLAIFDRLANASAIDIVHYDGDNVAAGDVILRINGPAQGVLAAERSALNIMQFLSSIATYTQQFCQAIKGTDAILLDTRKTVPGLRTISKYAVRVGGGTNHRMRLDDGILIKDNHIVVAGSVEAAVKSALAANTGIAVQVECDTLDQVKSALSAGADRLLLDNMPPERLRQAIEIVQGRVPLEASGGVNLKTIRAIAETGVDFISVGALTQSAPAVDIGLDYLEWGVDKK